MGVESLLIADLSTVGPELKFEAPNIPGRFGEDGILISVDAEYTGPAMADRENPVLVRSEQFRWLGNRNPDGELTVIQLKTRKGWLFPENPVVFVGIGAAYSRVTLMDIEPDSLFFNRAGFGYHRVFAILERIHSSMFELRVIVKIDRGRVIDRVDRARESVLGEFP